MGSKTCVEPAAKKPDTVWSQLDKLQAEHDRTKLLVRAVKGGRFRGRKPNGDWHARFGGEHDGEDIIEKTPIALVLVVAVLRCNRCGHLAHEHGRRGMEDEEKKGKRHQEKKRCDGVKPRRSFTGFELEEEPPCSCHLTPEEIRAKQTDREWIAGRLAAVMREREMEGHSRISKDNVFEGLREKPVEDATDE
ncbi:hypothetical protein [Myxococcus faecalis]|uniref:hypothetical protein n=1 Tax=Myxococcus faecalis TaxID=3115646 RepID=UPI003CE8D0AC